MIDWEKGECFKTRVKALNNHKAMNTNLTETEQFNPYILSIFIFCNLKLYILYFFANVCKCHVLNKCLNYFATVSASKKTLSFSPIMVTIYQILGVCKWYIYPIIRLFYYNKKNIKYYKNNFCCLPNLQYDRYF